ncbi:MAG: hydantoinase/oxoprolinase family protein, partial [Alphaproteobacteria bacterium]
AEQFLGGDLNINPDLAHKAIEEKIAKPLGMTVNDAALGIIKIINSNMALAIRANSVARGFDPREFSLMPFGGAGPLHGVALAEIISAREILVPPAPGINAAIGLLVTDIQYEFTRSVLSILNTADQAEIDNINTHVDELMQQCRDSLTADGVPADQQRFQKIAECRYQGQGFELRADMPDEPLTLANKQAVIDAFHTQHRQDYSYAFDDGVVEMMTLRVIGSAPVEPLQWPRLAKANGHDVSDALMYSRPTVFDGGLVTDTPRYDRGKLLAGHELDGPAIVVQHNSTTVIPPGYRARVSDYGNLHISAH